MSPSQHQRLTLCHDSTLRVKDCAAAAGCIMLLPAHLQPWACNPVVGVVWCYLLQVHQPLQQPQQLALALLVARCMQQGWYTLTCRTTWLTGC